MDVLDMKIFFPHILLITCTLFLEDFKVFSKYNEYLLQGIVTLLH